MKKLTFLICSILLSTIASVNAQWTGTGPVLTYDKVGIGVASPNDALEVNGRIKSTWSIVSHNTSYYEALLCAHGTENYMMLRSVSPNTTKMPIIIQQQTSSTTTNVMYIGREGNVGIGVINPAAKLTVNGAILAKEIKVKTDISTYPDFVFKPEYNLRSLDEVEAFINKEGHLPEVPKAEETKEGVNLGALNLKLLQKIEELTLYTIQQEKRLNELEKNLTSK